MIFAHDPGLWPRKPTHHGWQWTRKAKCVITQSVLTEPPPFHNTLPPRRGGHKSKEKGVQAQVLDLPPRKGHGSNPGRAKGAGRGLALPRRVLRRGRGGRRCVHVCALRAQLHLARGDGGPPSLKAAQADGEDCGAAAVHAKGGGRWCGAHELRGGRWALEERTCCLGAAVKHAANPWNFLREAPATRRRMRSESTSSPRLPRPG